MLTVCPEKIYVLHRFIVEIEERRENYVKAFVLSVLFKEQTHVDYDDNLTRLKTILAERMTKNGLDSIKTILKKGKSFLQENEPSIAIAVFRQILELLDMIRCSESLKEEFKLQTQEYLEKATKILSSNQNNTQHNSNVPPEPPWEGLPPPPSELQNHRSNHEISPNLQTHLRYTSVENHHTKPPVNRDNWQNLECVHSSFTGPVASTQRKYSLSEASECDSESVSIATSTHSASEESSSEYAPEESESESISSMEPASITDEMNGFRPVKSKKKKNHTHETVPLPQGIEVICEHFEKRTNNDPSLRPRIPKVCKGCEPKCFYAFWSWNQKWNRVRQHPSYLDPEIPFKACFNYQKQKPCDPGCTHPHGSAELQMWNMQRQQVLPSPESWFKKNKGKEQPLSKDARKRAKKKKKKAASGTPVAQQPTVVVQQPPCNTSNNKLTPASNSTNLFSAPPTNQPTLTAQQNPPSQHTCYLPKEVKIVCNHFMSDFGKTPFGILQKINVCKRCATGLQQSSIKYAFWSAEFSQWFYTRKRPLNVSPNTAFQECKDFVKGKSCYLRSACTFGHGPEVMLWTMDRQGDLVPPETAYRMCIKDESTRAIRPLPAVGMTDGSFKLCSSLQSRTTCRFGRCCRYAHSEEELRSWQEEYKQKMAKQQQQPKPSIVQPRQQPYKTTETLSDVTLSCEPEDPNVKLNETADVHEQEWTFHISYKTSKERRIPWIFLGERHCGHYSLKSVKTDAFDESKKLLKSHNVNLSNKICCKPSESDVSSTEPHVIKIEVIVQFHASVFGSFTQRILFDFGTEPLLMKEFNIDVISEETLPQLVSARQELTQESIHFEEKNIIRMEPLEDEDLFVAFRLPKDPERIVSAQMVEGGQIRPDTYVTTMHQILFAEEAHMRKLLSKLAPSNAKLLVAKSFTRESIGLKQAPEGHFFGSIELQTNVTPDDTAGRVCIRKVQTVLLQARDNHTLLYEAPIELLEEKKVTVTLFSRLCEDLKIERENQEVDVKMWFNLNRTILCRMHKALDNLSETHKRILFPEKQVTIDPSVTKQSFTIPWLEDLNKSLNEDQLQVIQAITDTTSSSHPLPLVVFGPFGTGKTFTLNKAILHLITKQSNRILLCTHTNSAADIHVELLDEYLKSANAIKAATPLRIFDPGRKISTVSETSRKYTLMKDGAFVMPSRKDLNNYRVIISTLTTADLLTKLKVHHGFFTHILIDEAAQAWETEALIPVALAGPNTKIVFTGDHMQMSPEVYTKFACTWGLQKSLPERLFDHYNQMDDEFFRDQHVMFLRFNYRSNEEILKFPSDNFYGGEIEAKGGNDNPAHPGLGPLMFYSSKGKDVKQHDNTYFNEAEVCEVVKRVKELADSWPECWGNKDLKEIAVIAPYQYQVKVIRDKLRKIRLGSVTVETIHNVQGKEFRALFISTVRTWNSIQGSSEDLSLEFLSDPKLLVTAVTRAKSLVAVVGDPASLCTLGDCQGLWIDFIIQRCQALGKLYGTSIENLIQEINAINLANKQLNPEAPCFVPRSIETTQSQNIHENIIDEELHEGLQAETESKADDQDSGSVCSIDAESDSVEEENLDVGEELKFDVLPSDFDEIVKAFIKKCENSKILETSSVEEEEDWPSLPGPSSSEGSQITPSRTGPKRPKFRRLQSSDYEMRRDRGHEEIRLIELHGGPEHGQQITDRSRVSRPEHLSIDVLSHMLQSNPSRYLIGQLLVGVHGWRKSSVEVDDKNTPDVKINGDVRSAFDRDTVVLDKEKLQENLALGSNKSDCIIGVLNHLIDPRERQYVCKMDPTHHWLMVPINKSVRKIANITDSDKSRSKIPVYRKVIKNNGERPDYKVQRWVGRKEAKKKKFLFVVEFLQWRGDCYYPLGRVLRTITQGETVEDCERIIDAEYGVRRSVSKEITQEIERSFPKNWKVPESEMRRRKLVKNAFTIDPPGSKDLDDAISVETLDDGTYKVGIHIADVSYFVRPGSRIDQDARQRGTTYYRKTTENIPMLPRELSENYCSLLEQKDRLTQSVYIILDKNANVVKERPAWTESTVTSSLCQLTYSQTQEVIEGEELTIDNKKITKGDKTSVEESIRLLHLLMQKLRRKRLEDVDHSEDERNDIAAHELIEEMMILANRTVGTMLRQNEPQGTTPFVCQLQPKVHRLNQWAEKYGQFAKYLPSMRRYLQSEDIYENIQERVFPTDEHIDILASAWDEAQRTADSGKLPMLEFLISDPSCSPQLQLANKHLKTIQQRAEYKCSGDDFTHHSLAVSDYVHFTSPIRRYMDIEIHRHLKEEAVDLDIEQVEKFCKRSTFIKHNSRKFEKECKRVVFSHSLKGRDGNPGMEAYIDELDNHSFVVQPKDPEQDLLSRNRRVSIEDLSVFSKTDLEQDGEQEMTLKWIVRVYVAPSLEESRSDEGISVPKYRERRQMESLLLPVAALQGTKVYTIRGEKWMDLAKATANQNWPEVKRLMREIIEERRVKDCSSRIKLIPYTHDEDGHYYEIELKLQQFDIVNIQLFSRLSRAVLCPDIQLFKITSNLDICLEHRRLPRRCFAKDCHDNASKELYQSIDDYINNWKPVLAMETATQTVSQNEGYLLKSHRIRWTKEDRHIKGTFSFNETFCGARQLDFIFGDFACVRIPHYRDETDDKTWVGHCVVKNVEKKKSTKEWNVELAMTHMVSDMPEQFLDGDVTPCDLEIIYQPVPCRRMTMALVSKLKKSNDLVQSICLGHMPSGGNFKLPDENLSLSEHYSNSRFKQLNEIQESAVQDALQNSFSMIQGPPGTGKTVTGVHIAYWFEKQNMELEENLPKKRTEIEGTFLAGKQQKEDEEEDAEDIGKRKPVTIAPPQVLYCGPSNKSVDVVTEYLLRIPEMKDKILRVYGSLIEEHEYPIPNKITSLKPPRSDDELKIPKGELRAVALHHVIRAPPSPYAKELRRMEDNFRKQKEKHVRPSDKDVKEYCETIQSAENWAIELAGKTIILCTCSRSGSKLIQDKCNIKQCIVDECGMTMEPEVLIPMTSSNAQQIVLIGDHKQLQPVVIDREAVKLGLVCSMFERLSERAKGLNRLKRLKIQYRMHPSICAFPSKEFYEDELVTDITVSRKVENAQFWPATKFYNYQGRREAVAFCHVEGIEGSSVISTSDSGVDSKYNDQEAKKAVQIAKCLVNQCKVQKRNVVILTPYREQRKIIANRLEGAYDDISVTTIIKSQGSEWDYVIISLVRSLPKPEIDDNPSWSWLSEHIGFIANEHQINVALTRAKKGLCVIGNKNLLKLNKTWSSLLEDYEKRNCVVDGDEWPVIHDANAQQSVQAY